MVCTRTERVRSQALAVLFYRLCCEACRGTSHSAHTHPLSSASSLKPAHTATLYCHSQMILLHFQLKGNVHGVSAYFWSYALRACSCDSLTVIHVWGRMRGFPPRVHVCFVPPIRLRWCEQRKVSSRLSTITQMAPEQCQLKKKKKKKKKTLSLAVCWLLWVCAYTPRICLTARTHLGSPETLSGWNTRSIYPVCFDLFILLAFEKVESEVVLFGFNQIQFSIIW